MRPALSLKARVSIVDDHAIIRSTLRSLFERHNIEVCEAVDGVDGVQKAQDPDPSLVVGAGGYSPRHE
jgi:DNA-binding NarL/FixJ family response regulator